MSSSADSAIMAVVSAAFLFAETSAAHAEDGRFGTIADVLTSPEFIDDCIGRDGGTIKLSFEPTYRDESEPLAAAMRLQLVASGAAARIVEDKPADWNSAASCDAKPTPGLRAEVFVTLHKDATGDFSVARVLVLTQNRRKEASLSRGEYPGRCEEVRTVVPRGGHSPVFGEHAIAVPRQAERASTASRQRARDRQRGLLFGAALQGGLVVGLRTAQAVNVEHDSGSAMLFGAGAYFSTLGLTAISAYTARSWVETIPPTRRRRISIGLSGAALFAVGSAMSAGIEIASSNKPFGVEHPGLRLLQAVGDLSAAAGVGLITFAVHRRVSLSPSMAGITVSGRF